MRLWICAVLVLAGCRSRGVPWTPPSDESWVTSEVGATSERILWQVTSLALERTGFPPGAEPEPDGTVTSAWRTSLAPFRGDGYREQAIVHFEPVEGDAPDRYRVSVRVRRERNDDHKHPLDLASAKWKPDPDDGERAALVMQYVRSILGEEPRFGPKPSTRVAPGTP